MLIKNVNFLQHDEGRPDVPKTYLYTVVSYIKQGDIQYTVKRDRQYLVKQIEVNGLYNSVTQNHN